MSEVQEILNDVSVSVEDRIENALILLDDLERYRCEDRKFRIIYLSYDEVNGMKYIGKHTTVNLNDGYLGSGLILQRIIKKYGKDRFDYGILEYCKNEEELNEKEKYWVKYFQDKNQSYNIGPGGVGGDNITGNPNYNQIIKNMSKASTGRGLGSKRTEAVKLLFRELKLGKKQSPEQIKNRSRSLEGHIVTQATRDKISIAIRNRPIKICPHCGRLSQCDSYMKYYHFDNCKMNPLKFEILYVCPYCEHCSTNKEIMLGWHFDNCRQRNICSN